MWEGQTQTEVISDIDSHVFRTEQQPKCWKGFSGPFGRSFWSSIWQEGQGRRESNSRCLSEIKSGRKLGFSNNHSMIPPFPLVNLLPFYAGVPEVASRSNFGIVFCCWCDKHQSSMVPNESVAWRNLDDPIRFQLFMLKVSCSISSCVLWLWM